MREKTGHEPSKSEPPNLFPLLDIEACLCGKSEEKEGPRVCAARASRSLVYERRKGRPARLRSKSESVACAIEERLDGHDPPARERRMSV